MKNFFSMLKQEIILEIIIFFTFLISGFLLLLFNVLMLFGISWYFSDFEIQMIIPSLIFGLKFVFVENGSRNLLYYWHIIFFFAIMGVIHLPTFMKYTIDEEGNKVFIESEKRTWKQWVNRFFILLISNTVILIFAGILLLSIDYLILLL